MFNSSSFYNPHLLLTTDTPQEEPVELSRKEFLGVGQGACYWHGVGGSRWNIIIMNEYMNLVVTRPRRAELASVRQHRKTGRPSRSRAVEGTGVSLSSSGTLHLRLWTSGLHHPRLACPPRPSKFWSWKALVALARRGAAWAGLCYTFHRTVR